MTAEEYLSEMRIMRAALDCKMEHYKECIDRATSITIPMNQEKVQSSKSGNGNVERYMIQAVDFEGDIKRDEAEFYNHEKKVINQIEGLHNANYIQVLFKVYVQFKNIKLASAEMYMSYSHTRKMHKEALAAFEERYAGEIAEWEKQCSTISRSETVNS